MTDAERIEIALHRFKPINGTFPTLDILREKFGRAPAILSRATQDAFVRRLVEVRRVDAPAVVRDKRLERRIETRLSKLRGKIRVIKSPPVENEAGLREKQKYSDAVHRLLGVALAHEIHENRLFVDKKISVGLGSGRSVFNTIEALREMGRSISWDYVSLFSLSGEMPDRDHFHEMGTFLDADFHVRLFSLCVNGDVDPKIVAKKISYKTREACYEARKLTHLSEARWQESHPEYAILGIGTFGPGHGFYTAAQKFREIEQTGVNQNEPVRRLLAELMGLLHKIQMADTDYYPIADICNQLFYVPHPTVHAKGTYEFKKIIADIKTIIEQVNARLLSATHKQLASIGKVVIVAGTEEKAGAILELITNSDNAQATLGPIQVQRLYTDSQAASRMLQLLDGDGLDRHGVAAGLRSKSAKHQQLTQEALPSAS